MVEESDASRSPQPFPCKNPGSNPLRPAPADPDANTFGRPVSYNPDVNHPQGVERSHSVKQSSADEAKFRRAFDAYFAAVNRYCLRRIPANDVNDVVAEVFAVAWRKVERMPDGELTLPWLYGVARNEVNNRRRANRRFRALISRLGGQAHHPDPGPETVIVRQTELETLMEALGTLRPEDRELLLLRTHEELDYSQIGIAVGCSPEAARKRLSRATSRLRRAAGIPEPQTAASGSRAIQEGEDQ